MEIIPLLLKEFTQEAEITRKFLKLVPADKFDWKPHEKSMSLKQLSVHIAELPSWTHMALDTDGMDFAESDYTPTPVKNSEELLSLFEDSFEKGKESLKEAGEKDLQPTWTMRNGDQILNRMTKYEVIRHSFSQTTHHRAQLGVYLRLLDIPIPGSYGPSADDQS
ncbi:MAG TPA: DinB family protein [Balneolaceae bacterium]|nr:DinB family protein [Balneolaceae bacterium]